MPTRSQPRVTKVWISTGGKNPQEERVKETPYGGANMSKNKQVVSHGVNAMKSSPENIEKVISGKKERWDPQRI